MFFVRTSNASQKELLEQEHPSANQHFYVAMNQAGCLINIIRSILFEHFRGEPPPLAKKIAQFVIDSLNMTLSLALFREILSLVRTYSETVNLFNDYFSSQSSLIQHGNEIIESIEEEMYHIEDLALDTNPRCSKVIYTTEFQQTLEKQIIHRTTIKPLMTKKYGIKQEGDTVLGSFSTKQKLEQSLKKANFTDSIDDYQWWKHQNRKECRASNNQSQQIVQFQRRGSPLINQNSINELVRREVQIDNSIESEYFIRNDKEKEVDRKKFNKKMKERLISAKLKKRKRKK